MISAEDLALWSAAPAPEIALPEPPNFRGHDLHFIRYNSDGSINSRGKMHREHIEAEQAQGVSIEIVDDDHPDLEAPKPDQMGNVLSFGSIPQPESDK